MRPRFGPLLVSRTRLDLDTDMPPKPHPWPESRGGTALGCCEKVTLFTGLKTTRLKHQSINNQSSIGLCGELQHRSWIPFPQWCQVEHEANKTRSTPQIYSPPVVEASSYHSDVLFSVLFSPQSGDGADEMIRILQNMFDKLFTFSRRTRKSRCPFRAAAEFPDIVWVHLSALA